MMDGQYYYSLIISLKMERSTFQSEAQGRDSFAETFGRGCLIKYKEPSFSERNNFEQAKINADRTGRNGHQTYRQWLLSEPQTVHRKQQPAEGNKHPSRCEDFERIEQINNKICGLIKSISTSCHKKTPIELNNERDSLKKYERDSLKKTPHCTTASRQRNLDHTKTQQRKRAQIDHELLLRPKLLDFGLDKKEEKYTSYLTRDQNCTHSEGIDINDRIRKINDKISNYQNKIKGGMKEPAPITKDEPSKSRPLKEYTNFHNLQENTNKIDRKQPAQKFTQNRMRYILNEKQNSDAHPKENYAKKIERSGELFRKTALFNEKPTQITVKNIKQSEQPSFDELKLSSKETIIDRAVKEQPRNKHLPFQRAAINTINNQLLSYKTQFLKEIVRQIAFDQDFRHAKHMFGGIEGLFDETDGSLKWNNLQRELKQEGFNLPLSEVKEIFMPRDDEIDPFMSVSHSHEELIHGLIHSYRTCERHWNENIYHSWSLWELKESRFTGEGLDQAKKGFIALEDLTCYLNTELDGNYRNRDLMLIFNRFKAKSKGKPSSERPEQLGVRFKDIMDKLLSV